MLKEMLSSNLSTFRNQPLEKVEPNNQNPLGKGLKKVNPKVENFGSTFLKGGCGIPL